MLQLIGRTAVGQASVSMRINGFGDFHTGILSGLLLPLSGACPETDATPDSRLQSPHGKTFFFVKKISSDPSLADHFVSESHGTNHGSVHFVSESHALILSKRIYRQRKIIKPFSRSAAEHESTQVMQPCT